MARPKSPPRIVEWRGKWYLFWTDPGTGKQRRESCADADSPDALKALLDAKVDELADTVAEMRRRGGVLAYDTPLVEALDRFLADVAEREALRKANPASREGLSAGAATELRRCVEHFAVWLASSNRKRLCTGELDAATLQAYFRHVAAEPTRRGNLGVLRSATTVNNFRRAIRNALRWAATLRPPLFPDFDALAPAFRLTATDTERDDAFAPATLQTFLRVALNREAPGRTVHVERRRSRVVMPDGRVLDGRDESFEQPAETRHATPVSRLFVLLALTGCRLAEALALRWADCDLDRGRLTIRPQKTAKRRVVPLVGAGEGTVAPGLLDLLRRWRLEAGNREHVLPHGDLDAPTFPKGPWQRANAEALLPRIGPQMLRRNWVSYAASIGVPAAVAAMWSGHSAAVAERFYRAQVLDRDDDASSIESAMGLTALLQRILADGDADAAAAPAAS